MSDGQQKELFEEKNQTVSIIYSRQRTAVVTKGVHQLVMDLLAESRVGSHSSSSSSSRTNNILKLSSAKLFFLVFFFTPETFESE